MKLAWQPERATAFSPYTGSREGQPINSQIPHLGMSSLLSKGFMTSTNCANLWGKKMFKCLSLRGHCSLKSHISQLTHHSCSLVSSILDSFSYSILMYNHAIQLVNLIKLRLLIHSRITNLFSPMKMVLWIKIANFGTGEMTLR